MIEFDVSNVISMEDEIERRLEIPESLRNNVHIGHVALGGLYLVFSNKGKGFNYYRDAIHKFTIHFYATEGHKVGLFVSCRIGVPIFLKENIRYTFDEATALVNNWFKKNEEELLSYITE